MFNGDTNTSDIRQATGVPGLDELLGGGLIPGTLTVLVGATGIGKTQLAIQFAGQNTAGESRRGIIFDMSARGDSQHHAEYARRIFDWELRAADVEITANLGEFYSDDQLHGDYLRIFNHQGRRVARSEVDFDQRHDWQAELNARLAAAISFFYGNFMRGTTRVVVDGIEPVDRPVDSIQLLLFEYIYHQILRKDSDWVARDLFRQRYREFARAAEANRYDTRRISCLLVCTSHESMLDELVSRPLTQSDVLSNANTLIYMGKYREDGRIGRALYVAKHRGSACSDEIVPFRISPAGLSIS